ncbi:glycerol-3-phosphate O-acyltransferase [Marchantia polymorpha subsp. ruderalis]|uniref:glycerol-3-phosphate 1-O-acyltransferase n=2 Tax=Marchantia polymorpha TaxID=3197 RepID=A0AAF6BTW0_MARPO|nr:hypothetical protein MARPO_0045s0098 [Marchantia polymorpha]BBN15444.1 hypothetical protein Mp_6g19650 [Marchantia polymorpha subsp. ruderalis]|eukprot:PTQ39444.1 hypothetical protein MARPO_0045s0098 [Marchantia polymorpha]
MAAALFQAAAGAGLARAPGLCSQPGHKQPIAVSSFHVTYPTACAPTSFSLKCSCRAKELPWSGGSSESSHPKNVRVNAITELAETSGTALRLEHGTNADVQNSATAVCSANESHPQTRTFQGVTSEEELLSAVRYESQAKSLDPRATAGMLELYYNYRDAVVGSGVENSMEIAVRIMATVLDRILLQFEDPFTFSSYHKRMVEPYDYYTFGQNYIRPLLDFRNSFLGNTTIFDDIESQLKQGHNVFLFANHQTEADPAVMALLLETSHPYLAENLTYIAGDRVVLDPFCKPFSMGRNLLCVYSKKHINDIPELTDMKQRANTRTLKEMTALLKKGGQLIWIAPSGGRDRPDPETNEWRPAPFDASAVENMRRLLSHMPVPGHMYPMALLCHDIMPPPRKVEKELGERRLIGYHGVGLAVAPKLNFEELTAGTTSKEEARDKFARSVWEIVSNQYTVLNRASYGGEGLNASTSCTQLSQPWFEVQNGSH